MDSWHLWHCVQGSENLCSMLARMLDCLMYSSVSRAQSAPKQSLTHPPHCPQPSHSPTYPNYPLSLPQHLLSLFIILQLYIYNTNKHTQNIHLHTPYMLKVPSSTVNCSSELLLGRAIATLFGRVMAGGHESSA